MYRTPLQGVGLVWLPARAWEVHLHEAREETPEVEPTLRVSRVFSFETFTAYERYCMDQNWSIRDELFGIYLYVVKATPPTFTNTPFFGRFGPDHARAPFAFAFHLYVTSSHLTSLH